MSAQLYQIGGFTKLRSCLAAKKDETHVADANSQPFMVVKVCCLTRFQLAPVISLHVARSQARNSLSRKPTHLSSLPACCGRQCTVRVVRALAGSWLPRLQPAPADNLSGAARYTRPSHLVVAARLAGLLGFCAGPVHLRPKTSE
jgi:hypothetical protein